MIVEFTDIDAPVSPALPQQPSYVIVDPLLKLEVILYWIQVSVAVGVVVGVGVTVIGGVTVIVDVIAGVGIKIVVSLDL